MAKTLMDLAESLEKRAANLPKEVSRVAVSTAQAIVDALTVTPVDTSNAVSNWQVTIESKTNSKIPPYYPGERGSTKSISTKAMQQNARNVLQSKQPGATIYISNVTDYIRRLNDGYSAQEPAGFVERSVLIGRKKLKKTKIRF